MASEQWCNTIDTAFPVLFKSVCFDVNHFPLAKMGATRKYVDLIQTVKFVVGRKMLTELSQR